MGTFLEQSLLDEWMTQITKKKNIFSSVMCIENEEQSLSLVSSGGEMKAEDHFFVASVTKLFVTTVLLNLRAEQRIDLGGPISKYLPEETLAGLHTLNNIDYTKEITVKQLMSNTSGIPDYFSQGVFADLAAGNDQAWSLDKILDAARQQKPPFKPGQRKKAQYSDTNYRLLGHIIENIKGASLQTVFKEYIFDRLNLKQTYFYQNPEDKNPVSFYYKQKRMELPLYMASIGAEGGLVSTARELMIFLRSFFNGNLFPLSDLEEIQKQWNFLWTPGPFFYGTGISRQPLSPFGLGRGLIGHWGQCGAFAFHHPESGLYFTGTVNQVLGQSSAATTMARVIRLYSREKKSLRLQADTP